VPLKGAVDGIIVTTVFLLVELVSNLKMRMSYLAGNYPNLILKPGMTVIYSKGRNILWTIQRGEMFTSLKKNAKKK